MSKNHRKMIFIFCVGVAFHLTWPIWQKFIDEPIFFTTQLNVLFVPIIGMYILDANLSLIAGILVTLCSICLSPILWLVIGFKLDIEFLYSTLFESYSILCITASLLLCLFAKELYRSRSKHKITPYIDSCTFCGNGLTEKQLFCHNCYRISPKIKNTLDRFPQKAYLDFTQDNTKHHKLCPHCNAVLLVKTSSFGHIYLGFPLKLCSNCQNVYLSPNICEWFGLSLLKKIRICLFDGIHSFFYILLIFMPMDGNISFKTALLLCLVITLLRIIWFFTITVFDIQESEARLKANPEYPHLLIRMGYQHFAENYNKLHNHK